MTSLRTTGICRVRLVCGPKTNSVKTPFLRRSLHPPKCFKSFLCNIRRTAGVTIFNLPSNMSTVRQEHIEAKDELSNESAKPSLHPIVKPLSISGLKKHFSVDVSTAHADILLLTCCLISGLVDSTIYNAFGTFVSMQTVLTVLFLPLRSTAPLLILSGFDHAS